MRRALIAATLPPHLSFVQALKSVAHGKHLVALGDSHPDGGSHGGVHARRGGAHVQHGHVEGALRVTEGSWSRTDKHTRERRAVTNAHTAEGGSRTQRQTAGWPRTPSTLTASACWTREDSQLIQRLLRRWYSSRFGSKDKLSLQQAVARTNGIQLFADDSLLFVFACSSKTSPTGRSPSLLLGNTIRLDCGGFRVQKDARSSEQSCSTGKDLHARSHMLADDAAKRQLLSDDENRDSMVDGQKI